MKNDEKFSGVEFGENHVRGKSCIVDHCIIFQLSLIYKDLYKVSGNACMLLIQRYDTRISWIFLKG